MGILNIKGVNRMRKKIILSLVISSLFLQVGCIAGDKVTNPPANSSLPEDEQGKLTKQPEDEDAMENSTNEQTTVTPYVFQEFDLEVDHEGKEDVIEVEYDNEPNKVEATYIDRLQDLRLKGDEALKKLDPIFSDFDFDENTPDEEVLNTISDAFNIPDGATFELSIEFTNGVEKEYRR